ncbi:MAG: cation:proton antiporter [Deltaproteobacteria bacterium]|jgi:CPA2 family monovalent cation:H+ antiporter-2|nr:cation:proton antiporter [Deltaproteobacteria bacterium]
MERSTHARAISRIFNWQNNRPFGALDFPNLFGLKLKMPAIVGFLVTGILVGQSGLKLINDPEQVEVLSELGVVLLLFTIGLEFSIQNLLKIKRLVLLGGSLQMLAGVVIITPIALLFGFAWNQSVVWALLLTLSSTAIVLKIFQDRGEIDSPHGRGAFAVLIFQDLAVVPLMVLLPILAGQKGEDPIYVMFLKVVGVLAIVVILAIWVVPKLMKFVAQTKSNELFMFTVALVCLGTAFLTDKAGLSLALGAFMAGMVLAGSPYAYQAISSVMPMRDIFTSLFFVSIGLKMNVSLLVQNPAQTVGLAVGIMLVNVLATALAMRVTGLTQRVAFLIGFSLCQIGEFAFVLVNKAFELKLFEDRHLEMFLNVAVLTMAMTPLALALGRAISHRLADMGKPEIAGEKVEATDHAIVVGFGVAGQGVARACRLMNRQYAVIDMNPSSVQNFQKLGEPIIYGDAVNEHVLEHVGIHKAAMLVVSIPDPLATRRIIVQAKSMNPKIYILARTRFLLTKDILTNLGADAVVAEEFEAAIEVFDIVLSYFKVPEQEKPQRLEEARKAGPTDFRDPAPKDLQDLSPLATLAKEPTPESGA